MSSVEDPISHIREYRSQTEKYKDYLLLKEGEFVAKVWVFNSGREQTAFAQQLRESLKHYQELKADPAVKHLDMGILPYYADQLEDLDMQQLINLHIIHEMTTGDIAMDYDDYESLDKELESIETIPVKTKIPAVSDWYASYATIVKFKQGSQLLNRVNY